MLITVHPEQVASAALSVVDTLIVVGEVPRDTVRRFCAVEKLPMPNIPNERPENTVLLWRCRDGSAPEFVSPSRAQMERRRHIRKYAEGELPPDRSFYFRGPDRKLNLRAQNLILFVQLAEGVDDETWCFHWKNGDYRLAAAGHQDDDLADSCRLEKDKTRRRRKA